MNRKALVRSSKSVILLLLILFTGNSSLADNHSPVEKSDYYELSFQEILDIQIETVSKAPETVRDTPAKVTVYTREDLDRLKPRNLTDLLELTAGFQVGRDVDDVSWGSRGVVTDNNQKYMVAIDGHRVSNNSNFGVNPFHRSRNLIEIAERIEIIHGSAGIMWGPDAFLGFINVVTRRPDKNQEKPEVEAVGAYGSGESIYAGGKYLEKISEKTKFMIFADITDARGEEVNLRPPGTGGFDRTPETYYDHFDEPSIALNARLETDEHWISGQIIKQNIGVDGFRQVDEYEQSYLEVGKKFQLDDTHRVTARGYLDRFEALRKPRDENALISNTPETRYGAETILFSQWAEQFSTIAGWDTRYYNYSGAVLGTFDPDGLGEFGTTVNDPRFPDSSIGVGDYYWNGFFTEGRYNAGDLTFRLGGRFDTFSDDIDNIATGRASVGYTPTDDFSVRLIYSRGALRPSFTQLTGFFSFEGRGNPDLDKEYSNTLELLFDYTTTNFLSSLVLYNTEVNDTISFVNSDSGNGYVNYADYETTGIEWENRVKYEDIATAFFNFTWHIDVERKERVEIREGVNIFGATSSLVRPGSDEPYNIPDFYFSTGISFYVPVSGRTLTVTPILRYIGDAYVQPLDDLEERKIDNLYTDLKADIDITDNVDFELVAKNIFDNDDPVGNARGLAGLLVPRGAYWEGRVRVTF